MRETKCEKQNTRNKILTVNLATTVVENVFAARVCTTAIALLFAVTVHTVPLKCHKKKTIHIERTSASIFF